MKKRNAVESCQQQVTGSQGAWLLCVEQFEERKGQVAISGLLVVEKWIFKAGWTERIPVVLPFRRQAFECAN